MSDRDVLSEKQVELCETSETDYSDLRAMDAGCRFDFPNPEHRA